MPRLYCEAHGRDHEAATVENQELYRQEGETVLIVRGRLRSGPWLCDKCNALLSKGRRATFTVAYPLHITETVQEYDFAYEQRYFDMENAELAVYGAAWPVLMVPRSGHWAGRPRQQRPLCALDLKPRQQEPAE